MANPFDLTLPFDSSATRQQKISAEIALNQPPMPTFFPNSASNPTNNLPNRSQSAYFKTRLCTRFMSGLCPKGSNCNFAHSIDELRARSAHIQRTFSERLGQGEEQKQQNYKICRKYYNGEICHYGVRCSFAHVEPGSLQDNNFVSNSKFSCWKTRLCHKWSTSGDCPYGDHCTYAHGDAAPVSRRAC
ncbi:Zinc finger CCCH domain-containing protein 12 [Platanthera guangdongensis]|uniref:Zinc finger CCCH domain-containing protein 12 n=1 Tax=Platanthera guangdongensis TaxID=2320717 RepID=A0ABR2LGZ1_9ASPA